MPELFVVHRKGKAFSASISMRGSTLINAGSFRGWQVRVLSEEEVKPREYEACYFYFIKPIKLYSPLLLRRKNIVLIDALDSVDQLPKIRLPFHFIFSSKASASYYFTLFNLESSTVHYHAFDHRFDTYPLAHKKKGIGYIGRPVKLSARMKKEFDISELSFDELLAGQNFEYHWTVKPAGYEYQPLTKTVTALAAGSIPIINTLELGEILPRNYPYHISSEPDNSEIQRLQADLTCEDTMRRAVSLITSLDLTQYSSETYAKQTFEYLELLSGNPSISISDIFRICVYEISIHAQASISLSKKRIRKLRKKIRNHLSRLKKSIFQ